MPVASEIASLLDALDAPAMLIRPEDMTVAAVNDAFARAYGRFRFEGKKCWEALHRADECPKLGLPCPFAAERTGSPAPCCVRQTLYSGAKTTELAVTARPVTSADGTPVYWLETLQTKSEEAESFVRGTVGASGIHAAIMRELGQAALSDRPFLIYGETGLGKELYARTVHENSSRAANPFVVIAGDKLNARDAWGRLLGADNDPGLIKRARGGTLFIRDFEKTAPQARELLSRVFETGRAPDAAGVLHDVSVRIAASAERTLPFDGPVGALLKAFAENTIRVAPLRERKEDVVPLAKFFVSGIVPVNSRTITQEAIECLRAYDWPGNMRELRQVLVKAAESTEGGTITSSALALPESGGSAFMGRSDEIVPLADIKDRYLRWAVETFQGPRSELAERLGVSERTLYRLYANSKARNGAKQTAQKSG